VDDHFSAPGDCLHEFDLSLVVGFAERRLAAHLSAFLFDEKSEVENAHVHGGESRWHRCLASF
jgi:hypothetical protein